MRIAWLGPTPSDGGGVPYMSQQLLLGLLHAGATVDLYLAGELADVPPKLAAADGLHVHSSPTAWQYDRWYSSTDMTKHLSGGLYRLGQLRGMGRSIATEHARRPYDVVYQFSTPELAALRPYLRQLPAIVVHPEVHAAGERRWHLAELPLARRCGIGPTYAVTQATLIARTVLQRRDLGRASRIIAPSRRFARLVGADCGIPASRFTVVPNPIDLERFTPGAAAPRRPHQILFVSRIAARKGVESIVALSHRLRDLDGQVEIEVIGDHSLWSDYRPLLEGLEPTIARYSGLLSPEELGDRLRGAAMLLQPSHYEPFALTVGEALACGVPVITTTEVGATEEVDAEVAALVAPGDVDALEAAVRALLTRLDDPAQALEIRRRARAEAERRFSRERVGRLIVGSLEVLVA